MHQLLTSESVTAGHPDKLADQISDAVVDWCMTADRNARVACEVLLTKGLVVIAGEITCNTTPPFDEIARNVLLSVGYNSPELGIDGNSCAVLVSVSKQSPDINQGVDREDGPQGAGDQGIMFGYANSDTDQRLPLSITAAHEITRRLHMLRVSGKHDFLRPDGKAQVSVSYESYFRPVIKNIVISTQHSPDIEETDLHNFLRAHVIDGFPYEISKDCVFHFNPTGRFVLGGPAADCGLTGRKIVVDTYGGVGRQGGGALSGKDPSKVDRSAAYAARQVAKALVNSKTCRWAEIQISYAIGVAEPVAIFLDTDKPSNIEDEISQKISENIDLTPKGIIDRLQLIEFAKYGGYINTATYGHFTSDVYPWEDPKGLDLIMEKLE